MTTVKKVTAVAATSFILGLVATFFVATNSQAVSNTMPAQTVQSAPSDGEMPPIIGPRPDTGTFLRYRSYTAAKRMCAKYNQQPLAVYHNHSTKVWRYDCAVNGNNWSEIWGNTFSKPVTASLARKVCAQKGAHSTAIKLTSPMGYVRYSCVVPKGWELDPA